MGDFILPNSFEMEKDVLGLIILWPNDEGAKEAIESLREVDFYDNRHKVIFTAIRELYKKKQPYSITALTDYLKSTEQLSNAGGLSFLAQVIDNNSFIIDIGGHIKNLKNKKLLREIIVAGQTIIKTAFTECDSAKVLDKAQNSIIYIDQKDVSGGFSHISGVVLDAVEGIHKATEKKGLTGLDTGYGLLNYITGGFQNSDLIIIAARPSIGKTALALNITYNAAKKNQAVGFITLEMSRQKLSERLICLVSGVPQEKTRSGLGITRDEWDKINKAGQELSELPIYFEDTPVMSYEEISRKARKVWREKNIKALFIDYLGFITGDKSASKVYEVESITRNLKSLAKELNIPVILLSQLNRKCEDRPDKRPQLSDLRDSGSIEQDCDLCILLYREGRYFQEDKWRKPPGTAELDIAKHRNGRTGVIDLKFIQDIMKFEPVN